jgi:cytosine/uracil/thiamine/allantoin permease
MSHFYNLGYIYGMGSSFLLYTSLSYAFPPKSTMSYDIEDSHEA